MYQKRYSAGTSENSILVYIVCVWEIIGNAIQFSKLAIIIHSSVKG